MINEEIFKKLDELWPFKRVIATPETLQIIKDRSGLEITEFAVTIRKDADITQEEIVDVFMNTNVTVEDL